jgi:serine-threonine kinase receptor-associated protein
MSSQPSSATSTSIAPIVCPGHSRPIVDVRFRLTSQDKLNLLISSCHDKTAQLRWGDNGAWIGTYKGHNGAVWSSSLDETGTKAITGSGDFSAKLWDATSGEELASFPHEHVVKAVDFSFDSKSVLTGGLEKKSFIFDLATKAKISTFVHPCQVQKAVWISESAFITGGYDGLIRMWDIRDSTENPTSQVQLGIAGNVKKGVTDIEFVRSRDSLVACTGRKVMIYDVKSLKPSLEFDVKYDVEAASMSPNGKRIVAGGSDLWLHVYDISTASLAEELSVHKGHHGPIFCTRWDTAGECFASGSEDGTIRIWPISSI